LCRQLLAEISMTMSPPSDPVTPSAGGLRALHSDIEAMDIEGRPPISGLAVVAGLVGLASVFALNTPRLWFVPAVAAGLALIALRPRRRQVVRPRGLWLAGVGLACAAFFGAIAIQRETVRQQRLFAAAEPLGLQWLELFKYGAEEVACELALPAESRTVSSTPLLEYYNKSEAGQTNLVRFLTSGVGSRVLALGERPEWVASKRLQVTTYSGRDMVLIEYRDQTGAFPEPVMLGLVRCPSGTDPKQDEWYVHVQEFVRSK
jgi:hypothetical protein